MVDYFLMLDQHMNVVKVPARGNRDLLDYIFQEIRGVYKIPDNYLTTHETRKALYDTIKSYLNDTENKPKEGK